MDSGSRASVISRNLDYNSGVRQLSRALHAIPQLLLVQPDQLTYDLAFALALMPLVLAGLVFFRQDAVLLFAISFLAGIVCLLALQLGRLTLGLPAWVGHRANHPLVASMLIACFFSPRTPVWVAACAVILFVIMDTVIWPQLRRVMLHPALILFGLLFIVQRQLGVVFLNPFDGRRLGDPLTLWYHLRVIVDPVKLYVGNVPGPIGATSTGAVLLGLTYLWYTRKVSLGIVLGFLIGIAVPALVIGTDLAFQLSSGPALFIAGYIAADRRRVLLSERLTFVFGVAAGAVTMVLRGYGQGQEAAWESLLLLSTLVTVYMRLAGMARASVFRLPTGNRPLRTLALESSQPESRSALRPPARTELHQPAMAAASVRGSLERPPSARSIRGFEPGTDPDDLVRQMRSAASRRPLQARASNRVGLAVCLVLLNPVGLWLLWSSGSMSRGARQRITAASVIWYLAVAGLVLALMHFR